MILHRSADTPALQALCELRCAGVLIAGRLMTISSRQLLWGKRAEGLLALKEVRVRGLLAGFHVLHHVGMGAEALGRLQIELIYLGRGGGIAKGAVSL